MLNRLEAVLTPKRRKWAYRSAWAGLGVLGTYGVLTGEQIAAWALLAAALLGMADRNTDPTTPTGAPRRAIEDDDQ